MVAVLARVNKAWNIFRELKSFLCGKIINLNVKEKVYGACVSSCMIYAGETWATPVKNIKLDGTEMRVLRLMCAVRLQDRIINAD